MRNQAMQRKINRGDALDVEQIGFSLADLGAAYVGVWQLHQFVDGKDYFVGSTEQWIWSIGRTADGRILAALDARFYQNPICECLWLR